MERNPAPDTVEAEQLSPPESVRAALDDLSNWRFVGSGAFSTVWVAREQHMDREVAVKVLERSLDATGRSLFEREITALGRLSDHPSIISVYRAGVTTSATGWLVMEYAPGGTCADLLRDKGHLPWPQALDLMLSVTDALGAAHDLGLLHLDVKPSNILIGAYGGAKLGDFGLVRPEVLADAGTLDDLHLTPHHAAPELIRGETPTPRSDLWSATSTLFELIDGRPPFSRPGADNPGQVMRRIEVDQPRRLVVDEPTGGLVTAVERCLDKDPRKRFQTARDLHSALAAIPRPTTPPTDVETAPRRWPRLVAVIAPILLIACLSWVVLRGWPSRPAVSATHSWFTGRDGVSMLGSVDLAAGLLDTVRVGWGGGPVTPAGDRLWGVELNARSGGDFAITDIRSTDRQGRETPPVVPTGLDPSKPLQLFSAGPSERIVWAVQAQVSADLSGPDVTTVWGLDASTGREVGHSSLTGAPPDVQVDSPAVMDDALYLPWSDDYGNAKVARFAADGSNPTSFEFTRGAELDDEGRPGHTLEHLRLTSDGERLYALAEDPLNGLMQFWEFDPENLAVLGSSSYELIASAHPAPPVVIDGEMQVLVSRTFRQTIDAHDDRAELVTFGSGHQVASRRVGIPSDLLPIGHDTSSWRPLTRATNMYIPLWDTSTQAFTGLAAIDVVSGDVRQYRSSGAGTYPPVEVSEGGIALGADGQVLLLDPDSLQVRQQVPALVHPSDLATVSGRVMRLDRADGSIALLDSSGRVERTWTTHLGEATFLPDEDSHALYLVGRSNSTTYAAPLEPEAGPQPLHPVDDAFASPTTRVRDGTTWVVAKSKERNGFQEYTNFTPDRFIPTDSVLATPELSLQPFTWSAAAVYVIVDTRRGPGDPVIATTDPMCPAGGPVCLQRIPLDGGTPTSVPLPEDASALDISPIGLLVATLSGVEVRDPTTLAAVGTRTVDHPAVAHVALGTMAARIAWFDPRTGRLDILDGTSLRTLVTFDGGTGSIPVPTRDPGSVWYLPGTGATPAGIDVTTDVPLSVEPQVESVTALATAGGRVYLVSGPGGEVVVADIALRAGASHEPETGPKGAR
ncbi:MAG: serine/threonine-protein kinase [Acidimicrobiia bacterium]